jgi:hypothetical protein
LSQIMDFHVCSRRNRESTLQAPEPTDLGTLEPKRSARERFSINAQLCVAERKEHSSLGCRSPRQFTRLCYCPDTFNLRASRAPSKAFDHVLLLWVPPVLPILLTVSIPCDHVQLSLLRLHISLLWAPIRVCIHPSQSTGHLHCGATVPTRGTPRWELPHDLLVNLPTTPLFARSEK